MNKSIPKQMMDQIGEKAFLDLGLSQRNLRHIKTQGKFPAMWYLPVKQLLESHGLLCPIEAFKFAQPSSKKSRKHD